MTAAVVPLSLATVDGAHLAALPPAPGPVGPRTLEQAAIERQPVCIGSSVASAGALSDVEGVAVVYEMSADGSLRVERAPAEDRSEKVITLSREDVLALDPRRPTFYSEIWSHQLGGRGARSRSDLAYVHCYEGDTIRPLPDSVSRSFRVDRRAHPAHVERWGGRRLD
jgi:hypothetical protein